MPRRSILATINFWLEVMSDILLFIVPFIYEPIKNDFHIEAPQPVWPDNGIMTYEAAPLITLPPPLPPMSLVPKDYLKPAAQPACGTGLYFKNIYQAIIDTDVLFPDGIVFPWYLLGIDENTRGSLSEIEWRDVTIFFSITSLFLCLLWLLYRYARNKKLAQRTTSSTSSIQSEGLARVLVQPHTGNFHHGLMRSDTEDSIPLLLRSETYYALRKGFLGLLVPSPESLQRGVMNLEHDIRDAMNEQINLGPQPPTWPIPPTEETIEPRLVYVRNNKEDHSILEEYLLTSTDTTPTPSVVIKQTQSAPVNSKYNEQGPSILSRNVKSAGDQVSAFSFITEKPAQDKPSNSKGKQPMRKENMLTPVGEEDEDHIQEQSTSMIFQKKEPVQELGASTIFQKKEPILDEKAVLLFAEKEESDNEPSTPTTPLSQALKLKPNNISKKRGGYRKGGKKKKRR